jgi:hypothetical protein
MKAAVDSCGARARIQRMMTRRDRGDFRVLLEDDLYITEDGAQLFTPQSESLDQPF